MGSLFQKLHHKKYTKLVARPLGREQGREAGREGVLFYEDSLMGLSYAEFQCQSAVR